MREYRREYPQFSLCGLPCGLCPRYHAEGVSRCPGCGGEKFEEKHPTCKVITCNQRHDSVEFCSECHLFPCEKYAEPSDVDSFVSYRKVLTDFDSLRRIGQQAFREKMDQKIRILRTLLSRYRNGRNKNLFCVAVHMFEIGELNVLMTDLENISRAEPEFDMPRIAAEVFKARAKDKEISLKLRK